jgi:hypothetical protein
VVPNSDWSSNGVGHTEPVALAKMPNDIITKEFQFKDIEKAWVEKGYLHKRPGRGHTYIMTMPHRFVRRRRWVEGAWELGLAVQCSSLYDENVVSLSSPFRSMSLS